MPLTRNCIALSIGNTTCQAGFFAQETYQELSNHRSEYVFPSVVTNAKERVIIADAYSMKRYPQYTIRHAFRLLGKTYGSPEVEDEKGTNPIPISQNDAGNVVFEIDDKEYTPEEVIRMIARHLIDECQERVSTAIQSCILSIPDGYCQKDQEILKGVIESGGIRVDSLIEESLCIGQYLMSEHCFATDSFRWENNYLLIFNLSESDLSTTVLNMVDGVPAIALHQQDATLSGDLMIQLLLQRVENLVYQRYNCALCNGMVGSTSWIVDHTRVSGEVKERLVFLSQLEEMVVELPLACKRAVRKYCKEHGEESVEDVTLTRQEVLLVLSDMIQRCMMRVRITLQRLGICEDEVYRVIPVGTFSQVLFVKNALIGLFSERVVVNEYTSESSIVRGICESILKYQFVVCGGNRTAIHNSAITPSAQHPSSPRPSSSSLVWQDPTSPALLPLYPLCSFLFFLLLLLNHNSLT